VVKIGAGQIRSFCAPGFADRGLPWLALGGCRTLHDGELARGRDRGRGGGRARRHRYRAGMPPWGSDIWL